MSKKDAAVVDGKDPVKVKQKRRLRQIEIEKAELELAASRIDLEMDKHRLRSYEDERKKKDSSDAAHGVFRLEEAVGHHAATELAAQLQSWGRANPKKPVTLYLCSPGGSVLSGFLLYDQLRTLSEQGHHVTTVVRGYAASMGGVLFLAGDTRLIGAESFVHIHEVSSMTYGKLFEMKDDLAFSERLNKKIEDLYVSRTKVKRGEFRRKSQKTEWWIEAPEAVALGIAHAIG